MEHGTKNPNYMHNWSMQKLYQAFFDLLLVPTNATASFCPAYAGLIFNVTQCTMPTETVLYLGLFTSK